jgi:hypothetical protein
MAEDIELAQTRASGPAWFGALAATNNKTLAAVTARVEMGKARL